jgi:hypothetical protein
MTIAPRPHQLDPVVAQGRFGQDIGDSRIGGRIIGDAKHLPRVELVTDGPNADRRWSGAGLKTGINTQCNIEQGTGRTLLHTMSNEAWRRPPAAYDRNYSITLL